MGIKELNEKFGINNNVIFSTGNGNRPNAILSNKFGRTVVSLYGGQVLSYIPDGEKEVLWVSGNAVFEEGKPIRGGIPVCWPWFGPHSADASLPAHGFARLSMWNVIDTSITLMGELQIKLNLSGSPETLKIWPYIFSAILTVTMGKSLKVELSVLNTGSETFNYTDALHSYFHVADVSQITILGLKDTEYFDATDNNSLNKQEDMFLKIKKEENRRYINTEKTCIIDDQVLKRHIKVEKENSRTTVVWNPGFDTAASFNDMKGEDYKNMICIEAANAVNDIITLHPGETSSIATLLTIE